MQGFLSHSESRPTQTVALQRNQALAESQTCPTRISSQDVAREDVDYRARRAK